MIDDPPDEIDHDALFFRKLDRYVRTCRGDGDLHVGQNRRKPQRRRTGIKKNRTAFGGKLCRRLGDFGFSLGIFKKPLAEFVLHGGLDEFHGFCAAAHLDELALFFEKIDVAPQRHACDVRKHIFKLRKGNERLFRQQIPYPLSPVFRHTHLLSPPSAMGNGGYVNGTVFLKKERRPNLTVVNYNIRNVNCQHGGREFYVVLTFRS